MRVYQLLAKALHLNNVPLAAGTVLQECRHKLDHTYVFLSGEPCFIRSIDYDEIHVVPSNRQILRLTHADDDAEIKLFTPESGAYATKDNLVYMTKKVKKFYKKSFSIEAYHFTFLGDNDNGEINWYEFMKTPRQSMYVANRGLFYMGHRIGDVSSNGIIRTNDLFKQDVQRAIDNGTLSGTFKVQ